VGHQTRVSVHPRTRTDRRSRTSTVLNDRPVVTRGTIAYTSPPQRGWGDRGRAFAELSRRSALAWRRHGNETWGDGNGVTSSG
jgi:hypothetical protein